MVLLLDQAQGFNGGFAIDRILDRKLHPRGELSKEFDSSTGLLDEIA
jgi:hypothetical protein